jgi:hypothetical protein
VSSQTLLNLRCALFYEVPRYFMIMWFVWVPWIFNTMFFYLFTWFYWPLSIYAPCHVYMKFWRFDKYCFWEISKDELHGLVFISDFPLKCVIVSLEMVYLNFLFWDIGWNHVLLSWAIHMSYYLPKTLVNIRKWRFFSWTLFFNKSCRNFGKWFCGFVLMPQEIL